jgi:DMSO/TMAO reductase YedYZ molybdopterin-dependent catalytic subunit
MLLNHLSRGNVARFGVRIHGEAVVRGEHTLYLIAEASDESQLRKFLVPFEEAGSVNIFPASTCAGVAASGSCGAAVPISDITPALDPADACQDAIESGLLIRRAHPLNCETSIPALIGGVIMPNARFYLRNHFHIPTLDSETYRLTIGGLVERELSVTLRELRAMRSQSRIVTLECAGNGRTLFDPPPEGEKWHLGAVSTAEWTGVPLTELLERAGVLKHAREVLFRGADGGKVEGRAEPIHFERSLRLDAPQLPDCLLAHAMNGEPLSVPHGFPLRLIVPGWYAVTSVKWLTEILLIQEPFGGFFQTDRYLYEWNRDGRFVSEPVGLQRVRALITEPSSDQTVPRGDLTIRGVAWSGAAAIARVEVKLDQSDWYEASLVSEPSRSSWRWWELIARVDQPGPISILARATDQAGHTQPDRAEWNRLGYGNNSVQKVSIQVV